MITRLARRLGFQPSVPVGAVDSWVMPNATDESALTSLAPRGGPATALVDRRGRIQPIGRTWTLDWTIAAGDQWVAVLEAERVTQRLIGAATLETRVKTEAGPIVQRVAAAVVDGQPVAVVEIENRGGVAVAVGLVARPLVHGGRGFLGRASAGSTAIDLGDDGAIRFDEAGATAVSDGADLLGRMPEPERGAHDETAHSRAGAAQAAAVFPLPHTATRTFVVELAEPVRANAAVPSLADVERGWARHLDAAMAVSVGDSPVGDRLQIAGRGLLTSWPTPERTPGAITALAELGFADDVHRLVTDLERVDDDPALLSAVARWAQLGDPRGDLDVLDRIIGPVARAAHGASTIERLRGPSWLAWALGALAQRLDAIEQPDVAERVRGLRVDNAVIAAPTIDDLLGERTKLAPIAEPETAARLVLGARSALIADRGDGVDLLPLIPESWRGRTIDVLRAPIEGGTLSFGVRWHGPRPALLWEVDRDGGPFHVTASAIDADFSSHDPVGETLLADPGWPRQ